MLKELSSRVAAKQRVTTCPDGSKKVEGVKDKYWFNIDHVPIWYEYFCNYTWCLKDSGHKKINTGGKDNDMFTAQIDIENNGNKLVPFLLFKCENSKCSSVFVIFLIS